MQPLPATTGWLYLQCHPSQIQRSGYFSGKGYGEIKEPSVNILNSDILKQFTDETEIVKLIGGQNESFRVGSVVLKKVYDHKEYLWIAEVLKDIDLSDVFLAKPLKAKNGEFIVENFGATAYFPKSQHDFDVANTLQLCRSLNEKIKHIQKPESTDEINNPWKKAQKIAWEAESHSSYPEEIQALLNLRKPINLPVQLVHIDLAQNILKNNLNQYAIIDFTPAFFPKEYAEAVIIIDSIAWHHAPLSTIDYLEINTELTYQLLLRALIFRLAVPLCNPSTTEYHSQKSAFQSLLKYFLF